MKRYMIIGNDGKEAVDRLYQDKQSAEYDLAELPNLAHYKSRLDGAKVVEVLIQPNFDDDDADAELRFRDTLRKMKSEHGVFEFTYYHYENDDKDAIIITHSDDKSFFIEVLVDEWADFFDAVKSVKDRLTVYTGYPVGPSPNHPAP